MDITKMTWKCHICGKVRPDSCISVFNKDTSAEHGLPVGTMKQNVRYCNDNSECSKLAPAFNFFKKEKGKDE